MRRLPVLAQDVLLAVFVTVMQVQGTLTAKPPEAGRGRSPTSGTWATCC